MPKASQQQLDKLLTDLAKKHLNIETLETRNSGGRLVLKRRFAGGL